MDRKEHHRATDDLDRVADEHDAPFGHRVGKGADEGGEGDIRDGEEGLEQGLVGRRRIHFAQRGNGDDEERVVGQGREKLRRHDDVEAERHRNPSSFSYPERVYTTKILS